MKLAVDPEAHRQPVFLRLDMNVRSPHLHGFFEYRLQELDDRRIDIVK